MVAGGLVGWLVFCFAAVRLVCKKLKRERPSRQFLSPQIEVRAVEMPLPVIPDESIYNEIEDEIEEVPSSYLTACRSPSYLTAKDDSEKSLNSSYTDTNSICGASVSTQKDEDLEHADALLMSVLHTKMKIIYILTRHYKLKKIHVHIPIKYIHTT